MQRAALERRVLPRAGKQTLAQLRACLGRAVLAIDPDGAQARYEQRRTDRRVVVEPDAEGMATLWALLSASDAVAAYQRLCDLARGLGADDPRGMDVRRADLLVDLLTGRRYAGTDHPTPQHAAPEGCAETATADSADTAPVEEPCCASSTGSTRPGKPLISVVVPITMLLGLDEQPGELVGYGPIPAALAREIAADGTWRRLLTDPASGALLDYGRSTYTPPKSLADFVRARDVHCRNPICGQPAATADLDHTVPWPDGPTSARNIHAACRHDHLIKTHAAGWHVEQHPDGTIIWTTPTGHTYTSHPHDYRSHSRPLTDATPGHDPPEDDPPPF